MKDYIRAGCWMINRHVVEGTSRVGYFSQSLLVDEANSLPTGSRRREAVDAGGFSARVREVTPIK